SAASGAGAQAGRCWAPWVRGTVAKRGSLPHTNNALERAAPSGRFFRCGRRYMGAAAHRGRSVPKAQRSAQFLTIIDVSVTGQVCRPGSPGAGPRRKPWREENTAMRLQHQGWTVLVAAVLGGLVGVTTVAAAGEQFIPVLSQREGALRFFQIPLANGYLDYLTLLNARDGGINGVPFVWEACETVADVPRGLECYERLKAKGPTGAAAFHPVNTPLTYALTERVTHDQIPLLTVSYGRSDASDGRVFPYIFNPPTNSWSQST